MSNNELIQGIGVWANQCFSVASNGAVQVEHPVEPITLPEVLTKAKAMGLSSPVLLRFPHIVQQDVAQIIHAFQSSCQRHSFNSDFTLVYPIKVNQQRRVVEHVLHAQKQAGQAVQGLEAGSKPELIAVLAMAANSPTTIVCNGYKDAEFIRLALLGEQLGHKVFLVVEKSAELQLILKIAEQMGVTPRIGARARLASIGKGNWQNTGGEKSKFGLTAQQLLELVDVLSAHQKLHCFELLHFHLGSQLADISDIEKGLAECAYFYQQLRLLGAGINTVDVGGGLAVDYDGSSSTSACSMNYSVQDYSNAVVASFAAVCKQHGLPQPALITESGRAVVARSAVLLANAVACEQPQKADVSDWLEAPNWAAQQQIQQNMVTQFSQGKISLQARAGIESRSQQVIHQLLHSGSEDTQLLDELADKLADKLFVNFSLFQSLPDVWGIEQVFPISAIDKLNYPGARRAVVQDMTCDSDGAIHQYVSGKGLSSTMPIPDVPLEQMPHIGFFMLGAYQEILGDMHNLFGDTDAVDVVYSEEKGWHLMHAQRGNSIADALNYVSYSANTLLNQIAQQLPNSRLSPAEQQDWQAQIRRVLQASTYLLNG